MFYVWGVDICTFMDILTLYLKIYQIFSIILVFLAKG